MLGRICGWSALIIRNSSCLSAISACLDYFVCISIFKIQNGKPPKNCFIWDKRPKLGLVKCLLHIPMSVRPSVGHTFEFAKCTHPTCVSYKLCKFINGIFDHYIRLIFPSPKFQISTGVYKFGLFVPKKRFS